MNLKANSRIQARKTIEDKALTRVGNLIVITGPSGVGKGTVVSKLMELVPNLSRSVSVTTRERRKTESEGVDYFFKSPKQFEEMAQADKFMEWAEFAGSHYGTPKTFVEEQLGNGFDVILEIEVKGAKQIKAKFPQAILIFLSPPSLEALRQRLEKRATESKCDMNVRLKQAIKELGEKNHFEYEVVNDDIDQAIKNLASIVYAERCRIRANGALSQANEHD